MRKNNLMTVIVLMLFVALAFATSTFAGTDPAAAVSPQTGGGALDFFINYKTLILAALIAISEVLAQIPGIKANSIFELIVNGLKIMGGKQSPSAPGQ